MSKSEGTIYSFVTKVRTIETVAIEKFFVPGKWLSSLSKSISSMLMTSFSRERTISLFYDSVLEPFSLLVLGSWLSSFVSIGLLLSLVVDLTNLMGSSFLGLPLPDPSS
jgi:hypothetical protein